MPRATGPGKTEIRSNPDSLMLFNFDVGGEALKREHMDFLRREAIPKLRLGSGVAVIGLTDRKGKASDNQALSERRVARTIEFLRSEVPTLNLRQSTGFGESAAEREGSRDGTDEERFRAVLLFLSTGPTKTKVITVTAKSYIALIGSKVGSIPGFTIVPGTALPVPRQALLLALAKVTDAGFNENPRTALRDKGYRLFSSCQFTVIFEDGKILAATPGLPELETDVGTEPASGGLQPPPLRVTPVTVSAKGGSFVTFSWTGRGRPHLLAEPAFQTVQPRTAAFIWHTVSGRIDVSSGTPVATAQIIGSRFPSHRVFINGGAVVPHVPQGPFSNLWVADPLDPTKIR